MASNLASTTSRETVQVAECFRQGIFAGFGFNAA
jgi:hypothetical protein